jgi:hypothetical protein
MFYAQFNKKIYLVPFPNCSEQQRTKKKKKKILQLLFVTSTSFLFAFSCFFCFFHIVEFDSK